MTDAAGIAGTPTSKDITHAAAAAAAAAAIAASVGCF
jgi:hypothetical protein